MTIEEIQNKLQNDLNLLNEWCIKNGMKVNVPKTKGMLFKSNRKTNQTALVITVGDTSVEMVKEFKYLGITLNETLNFEKHFTKVCTMMNSRVFMINRYKNHFTYKWRHIFSTSLIISVLDYCLPIWGNIPESKRKRINRILFRTGKMVLMNNAFISSKIDVIDRLNWLLCQERYELYALQFVKKHIVNTSKISEYFKYYEKRNSSRASKLENDFIVSKMKSSFGQSAFFYRSVILWNNLPSQLKSIQNYMNFDKMLRTHIINKRDKDGSYF